MDWQRKSNEEKYNSGNFLSSNIPPAQNYSEANKQNIKISLGDSPAPGIKLWRILTGHRGNINRVAYSPDGKYLASPSDDKTIRLWDEGRGECVAILTGHTGSVISVQYSPDGKKLASCSADAQILIWDMAQKRIIKQLSGHTNQINCIAWSANGLRLASGSTDGTIRIWETATWRLLTVYKVTDIKPPIVTDLLWLPESHSKLVIAVGHNPSTIIIWDTYDQKRDWSFEISQGFTNRIVSSYDEGLLFSAGDDKVIYVHDIKNKKAMIQRLEGHTGNINGLSRSYNGDFLASISEDKTVRIWNTRISKTLAIWSENNKSTRVFNVLEFHPYMVHLATLGPDNSTIFIWRLDTETLLKQVVTDSIRYMTAKLVLVGDSGVGKTGLGWRLAHNEFKEHSSTHGQQFWVIPELSLTRKDGTECEAVMWDLAGQHIYRSIHSIFLDDVDASLVLFDPTNRQEPLKGAQFWLEQLKGKEQLPPAILVGARLDRGAPVLSQQELDQFCQKYGISGGYVGTSAKSGEGLDKLLETLKSQIPWDQMTTTVTTVTFKKIKEFVLTLKESPERKSVLVAPNELREQLQAIDDDWQFTDAEMMTVVGHLANHGYVAVLKSSAGDEYILLVPELLASVAASIFLHADKHPRELGAINETELLQGRYSIDEFKGLEKVEQQVLLDATVVRFLEHSLCFRESYGDDNLLIFPSLIKQKRPLKDDTAFTDDISYIVRGRVENLYATLVVLLGYTPSFNRINEWQNQAQYETDKGNICGFRLVEDREGEIELILYYGSSMPKEERENFQALFEQFLYQHDVEVTPFPPIVCPHGHRQERATVVKRLQEGKKTIFCDECGAKTELPDLETPQTIGIGASSWLQREESMARLRNSYETYLVRIKAYRRGWDTHRCYVSGIPEQKDFANKLVRDLSDAGVYVIKEPVNVKANDYIIVIDSPSYQRAWQSHSKLIHEDTKIIQPRLARGKDNKLISITTSKQAVVHEAQACQPADFSDETHYSVSLYNLMLSLYTIPLNHAGFIPLRESLHRQWNQSLAQLSLRRISDEKTNQPMKVFISYSHKDEDFKDELVTMLAGLQRRGTIDAWRDRCIEEGDKWYQEIQNAMNNCDLAILLISANFIASRFIQDEELPKLLKRRMEEGLRVVPVIVKPCMWQSEPVLKDLQGLPRDGKPIITFSKDNGDRDQVWTDIARAIEKRAE